MDAVPVGRRWAPSVVATGESDRRERDIERCGRLGQPLQPDGAHVRKVASGSYMVNANDAPSWTTMR